MSPPIQLCVIVLLLLNVVYAIDSTVQWSNDEEYMNVFVVPHSHNDPGWWYTFEGYYTKWTAGIISSVVTALNEDPRRTFIWCETSFFSRWWKDQTQDTKNIVKKLVANEQLEFVGGGWVMNDEASVDIHQIINQYTVGHQWIIENIGSQAKPTTGWAIDPFGHSSAMAWAHREMGFDGMVINRVHDKIKNSWNKNQMLEFAWDRPWNMGNRSCLNDSANKSIQDRWEGDGMLTHMLAYKLYDIPNTCGPDWDVCAKFDFERPVAIPITPENIEERSETLLGQYRKKHIAFKHNNLLVPLGDDFKYKTIAMTRKMMDNYQLLFDHINSNSKYKTRIRFATLREYFEAARQSINSPALLPRYDQDFFTYSDRDNDYWSGYFTTRPYLKKAIRTTENELRSAQILFSVISSYLDTQLRKDAFNALQICSETLGLLQHHDAITGTAKQIVADDYIHLINSAKESITSFSITALKYLTCDKVEASGINFIRIQENQQQKADPAFRVIQLHSPQSIIIFNSLSQTYNDRIKVQIDSCSVSVQNEFGLSIPSQIVPIRKGDSFEHNKFWLVIDVNVPGLAWQVIQIMKQTNLPGSSIASVSSIFDMNGNRLKFCESINTEFEFSLTISNEFYSKIEINPQTAQFDSLTLHNYDNSRIGFKQEYRTYTTRGGSYLFAPSGESTNLEISDLKAFLVRGALIDQVISYSTKKLLSCEITIHHSKVTDLAKRLEIAHEVNLASTQYNNRELVSRVSTSMKGNIFYTDSAGLDMIERSYEATQPIQANFYPITTLAAKRDSASKFQFSALIRHALGVGTRGEGIFEFMLDRRTMQDDARGMGEKVTDQAPIRVEMWFILDHLNENSRVESISQQIDVTKELALVPLMNYPLDVLYTDTEAWNNAKCEPRGSLINSAALPDTVDLFSMQPASETGREIIFRFAQLNQFQEFGNTKVNLKSLFLPSFVIESIEERTLSLLHQLEESVPDVNVPAMGMRSYVARIGAVTGNWKSDSASSVVNEMPQNLNKMPIDLMQEEPKHELVGGDGNESREGILIPGDLPLLPGQKASEQQRVHILIESMRSQFRFESVSLPVSDYYFFLFITCLLLVSFLILLIQKRKRSLIQ